MSLKIKIHKPAGSRITVTLPHDIPLRRLLPALVNKLGLPEFNDAGQLLSYRLVDVDSGERPSLDQTLAEASVAAGSAFRLEAVAKAQVEELPPIRLDRRTVKETGSRQRRPPNSPVPAAATGRWMIGLAFVSMVMFMFLSLWPDPPTRATPADRRETVNPLPYEPPENENQLPLPQPGFGSAAEGTQVLNQPYLLGYNSNPDSTVTQLRELTAVGNTLFFTSNDPLTDQPRLHLTDGTRAGMTTISSSAWRNNLADFAAGGDTLYFHSASIAGDTLWHSDGQQIILNEVPPAANTNAPIAINGVNLYYREPSGGTGELWFVPDNSRAPDILNTVTPHENWHDDHAIISDTLYFSGYTEEHGWQLWRTDGTVSGTRRVTNFEGHTISQLSNLNQMLVFLVTENDQQTAWLWRSDGTAEGTTSLDTAVDTNPRYQQLYVAGDWVYFLSKNSRGSLDLWRVESNGLRDIVKENKLNWMQAATPQFTEMNGIVYFVWSDRRGVELWRSDGTYKGTYLVKDIHPGPDSSNPQELTVVGNYLYFSAFSEEFGREIWRSDGTTAGTEMVFDMSYKTASSSPDSLTAVGNKLFFIARSNEIQTRGLWVIEVR